VGHAAAIDRTGLVAIAEPVSSEQRRHVRDVLAVELEDLKLRQQQVGRGERRMVDVEPPVQVQAVAHPELA
jgi:hypothetical protein